MDFNESNLTVPTEDGSVERKQDGPVERKADAPLGTEFVPTEDMHVDPLAGAAVGKRMNGGFILIAAVILSAVAGLFSMRKLAEVTAAAGIDTQVEATIEGFLDNLTGTSSDPTATRDPARVEQERRVLGVLAESYVDRQVPLEDVKRDPFILDSTSVETNAVAVVDPMEEAERLEREREQLRDKTRDRILRAAEALELKSIVGGSTKMALIGKSILRMGETVSNPAGDIKFLVKDITTSSVDLVAEDEELELTVSVTVYLDR